MKQRIWFLLLVLITLKCTTTGAQPTKINTVTIDRIQTLIKSEMKQQHIPGMSVAILKDRKLVWQKGFGFADIENSVPNEYAQEPEFTGSKTENAVHEDIPSFAQTAFL